jgi:adenine-specific DNA-methyltransferase
MGEIFGAENYVTTLIRRAKVGGGSDNKQFAKEADFVLVFAKDVEKLPVFYIGHTPRELKRYSEVDEKGRFYWDTYSRSGLTSEDPTSDSLYYEVTFPDGTTRIDRWRRSYERLQRDLKSGEAKFVKTPNGWHIHFKQRLNPQGKRPRQIIYEGEFGNANGNVDLKSIFGKPLFSYPKPVSLIKFLVSVTTQNSSDAIVLDFFAGSCSTAHAVLHQNREDGGNRQFIMVQLPEPTPPDSEAYKAGYRTIAEIGKERIRRVIKQMQAERAGQMDLNAGEDLGFKVLKLQRSHFKDWQPVEPTDTAQLDDLFSQHLSPLVEGWQPQALLTEILLLEGFPLDSQVIPLEEAFSENAVWRVHHPEVGHEIFVCLDEKVQPLTIERLPSILRVEDIFICLDSALTDADKVALDDRLRLKVI